MQPESVAVGLVLVSTGVIFSLICAFILFLIISRTKILRKENEKMEAIRKGEKKYTELFENISDIVFIHSLDGVILDVNAAVFRELGFSKQEVMGQPLSKFVKIRTIQDLEQYNRKILDTGSDSGIMVLNSKSGEHKIFEFRNSLQIKDGNPYAVRGIARNITEQYFAKSALEKSEERYRQFFEEDLTGDFIASRDGKIISCNPAFARIFGFADVNEALNTNLKLLYPKEKDFEIFMERLQNEDIFRV